MKKLSYLVVIELLVLTGLSYAVEVFVGEEPNSNNTIPFWGGSYQACRFQTIWLSADVGYGGKITKFEWQNWASSQGTGGTFSNCDMLLCNTSVSAVTATFNNNYGGKTPVNVFSGTFTIPSLAPNQWHTIFENANFTYDNSLNLLFEVSWKGSTGGTTPFKTKSGSGCGRVYNMSDKYADTGTVTANYSYYGRLTIIPTSVDSSSIGIIRALFK
ncbi:MAG: hypothetical protein ACUVWP_04260 [bacterium]